MSVSLNTAPPSPKLYVPGAIKGPKPSSLPCSQPPNSSTTKHDKLKKQIRMLKIENQVLKNKIKKEQLNAEKYRKKYERKTPNTTRSVNERFCLPSCKKSSKRSSNEKKKSRVFSAF